MEAKNAEMSKFQQQLQEKDDEINRLRRELQRRKVHSVSTCMRQQFQPDLSLCAAAKPADMSIIMNTMEHYLCKWRVLKEQAPLTNNIGNYGAIANYCNVSNIGAPQK